MNQKLRLKLTAEEVRELIYHEGFKHRVVESSIEMQIDGSVEADVRCDDDGPEDGKIALGSIIIYCDLAAGHTGDHVGHDHDGCEVKWWKDRSGVLQLRPF